MMMPQLTLDDFALNQEYGSSGAKLEQVGENHFRMTLGAAPNQPTWMNKPQFVIKRNAKGNRLRLDVRAPAERGGQYPMTEYSYSWSYDNEHWHPISLQTDHKEENTFFFPDFSEDRVYFGHQVPMSYEKMERLVQEWAQSPFVTVHKIGVSLEGRNLYRVEITDPESPYPRTRRWGHYIINVHPGEHNAQWRMAGMVDWLLHDPSAAPFLQKSICHFVMMMSPDGPANGWYRVNAQGVDMNRSYFPDGSNKERQAHEAYVCQRDLEQLMAGDAPVSSVWNMHTWQGPVEPILYPGPEFSSVLGDWTALRDAIKKHDPKRLVKELKCSKNPEGLKEGWNGGPQHQFGITGVLCEGGGGLLTKEDNIESGKALMRGMADFYTVPRE